MTLPGRTSPVRTSPVRTSLARWLLPLALGMITAAAPADPAMGPVGAGAHAPLDRRLPAERLIARLRHGGFVILMRHANSPRALPDAGTADPANPGRERQLDATGLADARAFGEGLRRHHIPLGPVYVSPTFRARETLREARIAEFAPRDFLDIREGHATEDGAALAALLATPPPPRRNSLIVTHFPNVSGQFPDAARGMGEGDMLILSPRDGHAHLAGAMTIADWTR